MEKHELVQESVVLDADGCAVIQGQEYKRVGDKMVPITRDEKGNASVGAMSTTFKHPDGRQDVTVRVPCLQIASKVHGQGEVA